MGEVKIAVGDEVASSLSPSWCDQVKGYYANRIDQ
jgi:hypothetical protein